MTRRWPMRDASSKATAERALGDKVHKATLHTVEGRARLVRQRPDWEELRAAARRARLRALDHYDELVERFATALAERGITLHRAESAAQACERITGLVTEVGRHVTKSKSMTSEEIGLNDALDAAGAVVTETDLGELIIQLAHERPSHITAPALHLSVEDISRIFERHLGMPVPQWVADGAAVEPDERKRAARALALRARAFLRERFLGAEVGVSGANFLVADSGTVVLLENEGNIQLTTCLPKRHIVLAGTEKLVESEADLALLLQLLPVSATAQRQTCYVSLFADRHPDMHVVLLDHGRDRLRADVEQRDLLTCIRCGACMNACPVYRNVSGHAYGGAYPGPIGALLLPHLEGYGRYAELPFASSLCGACSEVCPVGIPLHERLLELRSRLTRDGHATALGLTLGAATVGLQHPAVMELGASLLRHGAGLARLVPAGRAWLSSRELPAAAPETFRAWWRRERGEGSREASHEADGAATPIAATTSAPSASAAEDDRAAASATTSAAPPGSLEQRFAERLAELGPEGETELRRFEHATEATQFVRARMAAEDGDDVVIAGEPIEKRGYELGISRAALLIAETGGVVLDFEARRDDWLATLVETHLVVGQPSDLVRDLPAALRVRSERRAAGTWAGYQVIVTGPSRTADVEKVLVIPAHGPRRLVVVLCDERVELSALR